MTPKHKALVLAAVVLLAAMGIGVYFLATRISSTGRIVALGVKAYSTPEATSEVTTIDWGLMILGQNYSRTLYIKNVGDLDVTLDIRTTNYVPSMFALNKLASDYQGQQLGPGQVIPLVLTLKVDQASPRGDFSFDIEIWAIA